MMMMITPINCADLPGNCNPAAYYINPIHRNAIVQGSFPRLTIARTKISHNSRGFYTLHYNRYLGDDSQVFKTMLTSHSCLWFLKNVLYYHFQNTRNWWRLLAFSPFTNLLFLGLPSQSQRIHRDLRLRNIFQRAWSLLCFHSPSRAQPVQHLRDHLHDQQDKVLRQWKRNLPVFQRFEGLQQFVPLGSTGEYFWEKHGRGHGHYAPICLAVQWKLYTHCSFGKCGLYLDFISHSKTYIVFLNEYWQIKWAHFKPTFILN